MKTERFPSIFNDIIGPVMRGPSSSHTAAAHRIGAFIRQLDGPVYRKIIVEFDRKGSLATTFRGQGSAMGLAGGLLGIEIINTGLVNYEKHLEKSDFTIEYIITDLECKHPNAYQITVQYPERENIHVLAISTGGGMIEIIELNGCKVLMRGDFFENLILFDGVSQEWVHELEQIFNKDLTYTIIEINKCKDSKVLVNLKSRESISDRLTDFIDSRNDVIWHSEVNPLLPVLSGFDTKLPFTTVDEMMDLSDKENLTLSELAIRYESARSGLNSAAILEQMQGIAVIIRNSIKDGLKGTSYEDRILGPQAKLILEAEHNGLISRSVSSSIIACTSALMEVKSSMGVIVAAPTAGACGVLGGALFGSFRDQDINLERIARGFMAAGIIGVFVAIKYTFSAEEGGCQVECGAASSMAAAGLVEMSGGTARQAVAAASMAMQNMLGIICDPVAVRVEVPCLGKNIMGATNALNSSIMAICGYDDVIPLDEVIDIMKSVGKSLPSTLCCTGLGGLAQTPCGKRLHQKFNLG